MWYRQIAVDEHCASFPLAYLDVVRLILMQSHLRVLHSLLSSLLFDCEIMVYNSSNAKLKFIQLCQHSMFDCNFSI